MDCTEPASGDADSLDQLHGLKNEDDRSARTPVATLLAIGGGSLMTLLILSAGLGYWNTRQLRRNDAWVAHTDEVLDALEGVVSTMKDSETGRRGYLITGEDRYLESYNAAVTAIQDEFSDCSLDGRTIPANKPVSGSWKNRFLPS